jgi:hypothetical protein
MLHKILSEVKFDDFIEEHGHKVYSWEAEMSILLKAVNPLVISLEQTSKGENDSDDWPVPFE